jgi:hypothetical protein
MFRNLSFYESECDPSRDRPLAPNGCVSKHCGFEYANGCSTSQTPKFL